MIKKIAFWVVLVLLANAAFVFGMSGLVTLMGGAFWFNVVIGATAIFSVELLAAIFVAAGVFAGYLYEKWFN